MNSSIKKAILKISKQIPDELYLRIMYKGVTGKTLHLNPPVTYNEKLQWLKLHNRRPIFTQMVDKYEARKYIAEHVGEEYLIPLLGVWNSAEEIDINALPNQFVLKCTHDCEGLAVCKDKGSFDFEEAKNKLKVALSRNFYYQGREWPYKNVVPRIIAEKYMHDEGEDQLTDYKVFNFNGVPRIIQVDYDRFNGHKRQFFDAKWNHMDVSFHFPSDTKKEIPKPVCFDEMINNAKVLSKGLPHLRTDFYVIGERLYIGELTFFHGTGMGRWWPDSFDAEMGTWLDLSSVSEGKNK